MSQHNLEAVVAPLYPGQEAMSWDGVNCYRSGHERPHWHFVTLWPRSLQLTLRVPRLAEAPPAWPLELLHHLAPQKELKPYTAIPLGMVLPEPGCVLDHALLALDPELGEEGSVSFLQILGITADEADAVSRWNARGVLELLRQRSRLWITDPYRKSILRDEQTARAVEEGARNRS